MVKALYAVLTVLMCIFLLLSFERPAMAYIDPGSGLFALQSISSIGVGALFFMRRRLRKLFRRTKQEQPVNAVGHPETTAPATLDKAA